MRETICSAVFAVGFCAAAFFCLTETLDEMTLRDCRAGVVKACNALQIPAEGPATLDRDQ